MLERSMNDRAAASSEIIGTLERLLGEEPAPGLVSVYVFGSHAAGRAHRQSDVDIGVVLDRRVHATSKARFGE